MKTNKLHLAELRYFDKAHNGVELTEPLGYGIIREFGHEGEESYEEVCSGMMGEKFPILKRVPYANYTADGNAFGTKLQLVSDSIDTGLCWVIDNSNMEKALGIDEVDDDILKNYVLLSKRFFYNRVYQAQDEIDKNNRTLLMKRVIMRDKPSHYKVEQFLAERKEQKQKVY